MKNLIIAFIGFSLFSPIEFPTQYSVQLNKANRVVVTLMNGELVKGYLFSADKESLRISMSSSSVNPDIITIDVKNIEILKIKVRKDTWRSIKKGALIGVGTGLILGAAIIASGDAYYTDEQTIAINGGVFGVLGTGIGALTTLKKKKLLFVINGNQEIYDNEYSSIHDLCKVQY